MLIVEHVDEDLLQVLRLQVAAVDAQAMNGRNPDLMQLILQHLQEQSLDVRNFPHQLLLLHHHRHDPLHHLLPISFLFPHNCSEVLQRLRGCEFDLAMEGTHVE